MSTDASPVVVVKPRRALPFFCRHPWVYEQTIAKAPDLEVGQQVELRSHEGEFIAYGLANPASKIRVRLYSWDRGQRLDDTFWCGRLDKAVALRRRLFGDTPAWNACRLIFSEADELSGLTIDRYGDQLLVQWTSAALSTRSDAILGHLQQSLQPAGMWLRTEKGIGEVEGLQQRDGLISGESPPRPILIEENGLQFGVDVVEGHKTGYYFDQRENRAATAKYCRDARVLDICCYTGSFSIAAAKVGGAREVVAVDSSAGALARAAENANRNGVGDRITFEQEDAYRKLEAVQQSGDKFDVIILDPPKMARTRGGLGRAMRGYHSLNKLAMESLSPDGILVSCSCSGLVDRGMFQEMLAKAALDANRSLQILESRGAASDHPVNIHCLDNAYLKCFICRITG